MGVFDFLGGTKTGQQQAPNQATVAPGQPVVTTQVQETPVTQGRSANWDGISPPSAGMQTSNGINMGMGQPQQVQSQQPMMPQQPAVAMPAQQMPPQGQMPMAPSPAAQAPGQQVAAPADQQAAGGQNAPQAADAQKPGTPGAASADAKQGQAKPGEAKPEAEGTDKKAAMDIMTRLTQRSNRVLMVAAQKATTLGNQFVDSEHVLSGLMADTEVFTMLSQLKVIPQEITKELDTNVFKQGTTKDKPQLAPRVKKILEDALIVARKLGFEFISPEHILYALYNEGEGMGARVLAKLGLNKDELGIKVLGKKKAEEEAAGKAGEKKQSAMDKYTTDLTQKAQEGKLDPVVERSDVIERVIHVLSRRAKNNPVLTGEAGVGKTAVVEGLAQKIVAKEVPESLLNKRVLELDLMALVAGASRRGEFEERFKAVLDELKSSKGQVIIFIDEIHNIAGAGGSDDAGSAANIIKPALARGEIQLIGATTTSEYRKHIEKDPALERRFQPIVVPEPTEEAAVKMMFALRDKFEAFHKVKIPDEALEAAVKLSKRYVGGRFLPDKAIDLIDETASSVRLPILSLPEEIRSVETRIAQLSQEKAESLATGNKIKAGIIEKKIIDTQDELKVKQDEYQQRKAQSVGVVNLAMIKNVIARWTGIPVNKIAQDEQEKVLKLEDIMHKRLIGQDVAIKAVSQAIRRGRAGLKNPGRPIGSFVFLGPTGVGKTELVKTLAEVLFGTEDSMIRFDMTEFMEKHEISKLLGAPPGYVGYEEGGKLTEAVKRKPYSVVLFDEIEKAHPDIFNILLQLLDDGRLTDNKGHTISFKNTVVICTSNLGSKMIQQELMKGGKEQVEEPPALNTFAMSPRGRAILTVGNTLFIREDENAKWEEKQLRDYFAGQKVLEIDPEGKDKEVEMATIAKISTHAISPQGAEFITIGDDIYVRTATTSKEWRKQKLLAYFQDNVVINALPDMPEEQLPTAKISTHAFTPAEEEIVTYKNRVWKRKTGTNDWETMGLSEYTAGAKTVDGKAIPTTYWNIHVFTSKGEETVVIGESVFSKSASGWAVKGLGEYFGKGFPLEEKIRAMQEQESSVETQKFAKLKTKVMDELLKFMRPELVNRFDEVVVFEPLRYEHIIKIVKLQIKGLLKLLEEQNMGLEVTEAAQKEIGRLGFDPVFGARPLRRAMQQYVENPISELIIGGKAKEGDAVIVDFNGEELVFGIDKAKLIRKDEMVKKTFTCETCQNHFETLTASKKSTVVCTKCGHEVHSESDEAQQEKKNEELKAAADQGSKGPTPNPNQGMSMDMPGSNSNGKSQYTNGAAPAAGGAAPALAVL